MIAKLVEIRDRGTFIIALATRMDGDTDADYYLLDRAGYTGSPLSVLLARVEGDRMNQATCDPREWDSRTMVIAHSWLLTHFDELESGGVLDVEYLLGLTPTPKRSERLTRSEG